MILRLRSRDGLERIEVDDEATLSDLLQAISVRLNIPVTDMTISKDKALPSSKSPESFTDLKSQRAKLKALGLAHGDLVYMYYPFERLVEPAYKKSAFESRQFGPAMTMEKMIANQTRIERQETPHAASVSFDRQAANQFQAYCSNMLAFSIKRAGLLYGVVEEGGHVLVQAVYEPPQSATPDALQLERGSEEEQRADYLAKLLGLQKVGWILAQSTKERDFIISEEELQHMAAVQAEMGEHAVTALVALVAGEDGSDVHFEAFQCSDQCVALWRDNWFQPPAPEPRGLSTLRNPKDPSDKTPVIVAGKDQGELDNDYFLIPVNIRDHEGPLLTEFPIENRLLPQGVPELRAQLQKLKARPYVERISDFHLLLFLSRQPNFDLATDIAALAQAVANHEPVPEGYTMIIDYLAQQ